MVWTWHSSMVQAQHSTLPVQNYYASVCFWLSTLKIPGQLETGKLNKNFFAAALAKLIDIPHSTT